MNHLDKLTYALKGVGAKKESKEVFLLKKSYLVNEISYLKKYLTEGDDESNGRELAELNRTYFMKWL